MLANLCINFYIIFTLARLDFYVSCSCQGSAFRDWALVANAGNALHYDILAVLGGATEMMYPSLRIPT
jgi:hypothetical protein